MTESTPEARVRELELDYVKLRFELKLLKWGLVVSVVVILILCGLLLSAINDLEARAVLY